MLAWEPECGCTLTCSAPKICLASLESPSLRRCRHAGIRHSIACRITFRILIGQHAALCGQDRRTGKVFRGDQEQLVPLPDFLGLNGGVDLGVGRFSPSTNRLRPACFLHAAASGRAYS